MPDEKDHSLNERVATLEANQTNLRKDVDAGKSDTVWLKRGVFGVLVALVLDLANRFTGGAQ